MIKLTPNSIKRPAGVPLKLEKVEDGLYVARNAYEGHYEYFEGRPLPEPESEQSKPKSDTPIRLAEVKPY